jgi:hypothetical protein
MGDMGLRYHIHGSLSVGDLLQRLLPVDLVVLSQYRHSTLDGFKRHSAGLAV